MSEALVLAEQQLLAPGGLDQNDLVKVLDHLMGSSVDSGDLYFQHSIREAWSIGPEKHQRRRIALKYPKNRLQVVFRS